jgi:hypothetical protein
MYSIHKHGGVLVPMYVPWMKQILKKVKKKVAYQKLHILSTSVNHTTLELTTTTPAL